MIEAGTIVDGKYRVERVLGQGGMGVVLVATHVQLGQRVALKVLHDASDPIGVERFLREGRASVRLRSDHVCRVFDVGQLDSGAPYIVMELLDGEDLAHVIRRAPLDVRTAADYVLQACVALAEAHALGIVHRDLKPSNLFLARRVGQPPIIKVLDFGIAKTPGAGDFQITNTATMLGSPGYMSPEQLRSTRDADARSDIWSLGVILYELASGKLPFAGATFADLVVKVSVDPPDPLDADPAYVAIVMRCLDKEPERRPASVAELAHDLAGCASAAGRGVAEVIGTIERSAQITAPPLVASTARTEATVVPRPAQTTLGAASGQVAPRRTGLLMIGGGLAIAAIAVAATLALTHTPAPVAVADAAVVVVARADASVQVPVPVPAADAAVPDAFDLSAAVARCDKLRAAESWRELEACAKELPPDLEKLYAGVARVGAQHAYRDAKVAEANKLAADRKCDELDKLRRREPPEIQHALAGIACTPKDADQCSGDAIEARRRYAMAEDGRGNHQTAITIFESVLVCNPKDPSALTGAFRAACNAGQIAMARGFWLRLGSPNGLGTGCLDRERLH